MRGGYCTRPTGLPDSITARTAETGNFAADRLPKRVRSFAWQTEQRGN
jgi:hypothetical protein